MQNLVFLGIFRSLIKHAWTKHQGSSLGFCRLPVSADKFFFCFGISWVIFDHEVWTFPVGLKHHRLPGFTKISKHPTIFDRKTASNGGRDILSRNGKRSWKRKLGKPKSEFQYPKILGFMIFVPRKPKDQTLPISRESFTSIILKSVLCLVRTIYKNYSVTNRYMVKTPWVYPHRVFN